MPHGGCDRLEEAHQIREGIALPVGKLAVDATTGRHLLLAFLTRLLLTYELKQPTCDNLNRPGDLGGLIP